jgi:hypothetical protein
MAPPSDHARQNRRNKLLEELPRRLNGATAV